MIDSIPPNHSANTQDRSPFLQQQTNELIVDWPQRRMSKMTRFDLEMTSVRYFDNTNQENDDIWYTKADQESFHKNALNDLNFFRSLVKRNEKIDTSQYSDRKCSWGLENNIAPGVGKTILEEKKNIWKAVMAMQREQEERDVYFPMQIAEASMAFSRKAQERARKIGKRHESQVHNGMKWASCVFLCGLAITLSRSKESCRKIKINT